MILLSPESESSNRLTSKMEQMDVLIWKELDQFFLKT